jgi:hypothetical protein
MRCLYRSSDRYVWIVASVCYVLIKACEKVLVGRILD